MKLSSPLKNTHKLNVFVYFILLIFGIYCDWYTNITCSWTCFWSYLKIWFNRYVRLKTNIIHESRGKETAVRHTTFILHNLKKRRIQQQEYEWWNAGREKIFSNELHLQWNAKSMYTHGKEMYCPWIFGQGHNIMVRWCNATLRCYFSGNKATFSFSLLKISPYFARVSQYMYECVSFAEFLFNEKQQWWHNLMRNIQKWYENLKFLGSFSNWKTN